MVPEGWKLSTFESHIDCLTGYAFKSSGYVNSDNGVKLLRGDNISPNGLRWREAKYWPEEGAEDLAKFQLHSGDFVIALDRTWISSGIKVAEVTPDDLPCLLVQRVARLRAKSSLEQGLLRHYFSGHRFTEYVKRSQTMTAVPHISPTDLKEFTFLLPTKSEQKKISEILATWDKAITATEQLLANSQQQKKALMQQLLTGKKRLCDARGIQFKSEWRTGHLIDISKISKGKALSSKNLIEGQYPVIAGGKASPYKHNAFTHEGVITVSASGAYAGYVAYHPYKIWASDCSVVEDTEESHIEFIYHLMSFLQTKIYSLQSGGAQPHIYPKDLASLKLQIPPIEEQKVITKVISVANHEANALQQKLDILKQEKRALMQQLLTGKRRVKVDEEAAA